jgi:ABC-type glutathione transport system ATPase component
VLEICDELIVLQSGRIIDRGPSKDVRERMTAGWARLVADRHLDSEENLRPWVRNLFKRPGDELNRKLVTSIACELLALSCQTTESNVQERLAFEFMHKKGYCLLRLIDDDEPVSSGTLKRARTEIENGFPSSSLALVLNSSQSFECSLENGKRVITLQIRTYDPRTTVPAPADRHG